MADNEMTKSVWRRILDRIFARPKIAMIVLAALAAVSYLVQWFFGDKEIDVTTRLILLPAVVFVFFFFKLDFLMLRKSPAPTAFIDFVQCFFFFFMALAIVLMMIDYVSNIQSGMPVIFSFLFAGQCAVADACRVEQKQR